MSPTSGRWTFPIATRLSSPGTNPTRRRIDQWAWSSLCSQLKGTTLGNWTRLMFLLDFGSRGVHLQFRPLVAQIHVLEEVTGSDAPMEPLHCPVSAPIAGTEQHQTPVESFDGQICVRAAEVGDHRRVNRRFPNNRMGRWTLELQDGAAGILVLKNTVLKLMLQV